jgi:restriction system protein
MPIPPYLKFIEPVLRYLALHPQGARIRDVYEAVAPAIGLSDQERLEIYPYGMGHRVQEPGSICP